MDIAKRKHTSEDTPTARLMKAMRFGGKDLDLNRKGSLSESQKKRLSQGAFKSVLVCAVFVALFGTSFYITLEGSGGLNLASGFVGCVLLFSLVLTVIIIYDFTFKLDLPQAVAFTGRVRKHADAPGLLLVVINHELQTEQIYPVNSTIYNAFIDGETYTLYALSTAPAIVLTAEHVSS